jgi:hypothetical protein
MTSKFFLPLSFVAVFGSGIRGKHPGSATLVYSGARIPILFSRIQNPKDPGSALKK